jgi:hypothetical protein
MSRPDALKSGFQGARTTWNRAFTALEPLKPASRRQNALEPGLHGVRTHWIRGFMAFLLARRIRTMMLTVPVCLKSGFSDRAARPRSS